MTKLKLGPLPDEKPIKATVDIPAAVYRELTAYAEAHAAETGSSPVPPEKLLVPMAIQLMATDRGFRRWLAQRK